MTFEALWELGVGAMDSLSGCALPPNKVAAAILKPGTVHVLQAPPAQLIFKSLWGELAAA